MSEWFRGVLEGVYVGTPAKVTARSSSDVTPFDIRLYRASIGSIERIAPPEDDGDVGVKRVGDSLPGEGAERSLRQAELLDVTFCGVGSADARDLHAAYDLRVTDVRLTDSVESEGRIYGRLVGTVVGCLQPSSPVARRGEFERKRAQERNARLGTWVESLRWVMVALATWLAFGLCGPTAGTLWLAVVLPSALLRLLTSGVITSSHGVRVFGWSVVLATAVLGGLLVYRVMRLECDSALWWISGMVLGVLASAVLPSRYPFLWTKLILAGTTLSLCGLGGSACETDDTAPSVVSQGPRTDPNGRWPRTPDDVPAASFQSRETAQPMSLAAALALDGTAWASDRPRVVMVPAGDAIAPTGELIEPTAVKLRELLTRYALRKIVLEVHGEPEAAEARAESLRTWLESEQSAEPQALGSIDVVSMGRAFPLVPVDGDPEAVSINDRLELWIAAD